MSTSILVTMAAGDVGAFRISALRTVAGEPPRSVGAGTPARLAVYEGHATTLPGGTHFALRGSTGATRYTHRRELAALAHVQPPLGRPEATHGAMIAIQKSDAWWELPQDERRAVFEEGSHHIAASLRYLPAVARRLYHARELGEPYDFLTWFEFAEEHAPAFDELLGTLRASDEWKFVVRELEIRFTRGG